jgi:GTP-binding protein
MKTPQARFITSASRIEECPRFETQEYAVVGRSNVGKSSLLNALANQKSLARTSHTPGRTQLINYFDFGPFMIADLPGYGYAQVSKAQQAHWRRELARYLKQRDSLAGVMHLMDARHPLQPNDLEMREFLLAYEVPLLVILTKVDAVKQADLAKAVHQVEEATEQIPILFSSRTGRGRQELWRSLVQGAPETDDEGTEGEASPLEA